MQTNNSMMEEVIPLEFYLSQNYPNPFKERTKIKYCLAYKTKVHLTVYDSEGNVIQKLVDEEKQPGTYEVEFSTVNINGSPGVEKKKLSDGYYYYRMMAGDFRSEKKWLCKNSLY
jgi:hypothetical protein